MHHPLPSRVLLSAPPSALRLSLQVANMLAMPLSFAALITRFRFNATWYSYAAAPTVLGMIIGQVVLMLVMAVFDPLYTLPQLYVALVLQARCVAVPRAYARLDAASPTLAALLAAVPVVGKFPLDAKACNGYFAMDLPFYLGLRTAELAIPYITAVSFGPAFPPLYAIALAALLCGEAQDRVKVLRRLKRLPKQSSDELPRLLTGIVFPLGLLCRMLLLPRLLDEKLAGQAAG